MTEPAPRRSLVVLAFASVYVLWGSTYLAIRLAVATLPPLTMAGARFVVAGGILWVLTRRGSPERTTPLHWRSATIVGALMLFGGNGSVVWAETMVDSGVAALIVATTPLWMVGLHALGKSGVRPRAAELAGLALGFAGVWVLIDPSVGRPVHPFGAGLLLVAAASWAAGSLYSRRAPLPRSPLLATAIEMLAGGAVLLAAAGIKGEWAAIDPARFSAASIAALGYLIVFGSLVGFTAYIWLLRVSAPAKVATYAYVNPVVAVVLGWAILDEPIASDTVVASTLIVLAVVLTTVRFRRHGGGRRATEGS